MVFKITVFIKSAKLLFRGSHHCRVGFLRLSIRVQGLDKFTDVCVTLTPECLPGDKLCKRKCAKTCQINLKLPYFTNISGEVSFACYFTFES